jgi:hypothetical protein
MDTDIDMECVDDDACTMPPPAAAPQRPQLKHRIHSQIQFQKQNSAVLSSAKKGSTSVYGQACADMYKSRLQFLINDLKRQCKLEMTDKKPRPQMTVTEALSETGQRKLALAQSIRGSSKKSNKLNTQQQRNKQDKDGDVDMEHAIPSSSQQGVFMSNTFQISIFGILCREHADEPNALSKFIRKQHTAGTATATTAPTFGADQDPFSLEDCMGNVITLDLNQLPKSKKTQVCATLVTGVVLCCHGWINQFDHLVVEQITFPNTCQRILQPKSPFAFFSSAAAATTEGREAAENQRRLQQRRRVAMISGPSITDASRRLLLLKHFLDGDVGTPEMVAESMTISDLIIVGNCFNMELDDLTHDHILQAQTILSLFLNGIAVTIIPGDGDPSDLTWPQKEIPLAYLQSSASSSLSQDRKNTNRFSHHRRQTALELTRATNPAWIKIYDEHRNVPSHSSFSFSSVEIQRQPQQQQWILATSGKNIDDVHKHVSRTPATITTSTIGMQIDSKSESPRQQHQLNEKEEETSLDIMERMLEWKHLAPTAPSSLLSCCDAINNGFGSMDPFVMDRLPRIFVAGNQSHSACRYVRHSQCSFDETTAKRNEVETTLILSLSSFHKTGSVAIVDLDSLEVEWMQFKEK